MKRWLQVAVMVVAGMCPVVLAADGGGHGIDVPMSNDPAVTETPRVKSFDPRLKDLWAQAMGRPELEMRMHSLDAIAQAKLQGMVGLEGLAGRIQALVEDDGQPSVIHAAAVKALDALNARQAGEEVLRRVKKRVVGVERTPELILTADPVLAKWKVNGAGEMWIARVKEGTEPDQSIASAMRSLGVTAGGGAGGVDVLKAAVTADRPMVMRLIAAKALAGYPASDLGNFADSFAASKSVDDRLLAVSMLPVSKDQHVVKLLVGLAQDAEPAVVATAAGKLWAGAPETMGTLTTKLAVNVDLSVRRIAVDVLHFHASAANVGVLGKLLDDESPAVRAAAREALIDLDAKADLRNAVRTAAKTALGIGDEGAGAYAQEQAGFIVGTLHENSARDRLVQLLESPDAPVRLAAVIGLRRLATGDNPVTDTVAVQYARVQAVFAASNDPARVNTRTAKMYMADVNEISQLFQNLGLRRYTEADGFMRKFIPKGAPAGLEARTGAIWALGLLHEGKVDAGLSRELVSRLTDNSILNPEAPPVRAMSAISLGRMRDKGAKGALSRVAGEEAGS
ncbi:MAG: hypothetical protein FWD53_08345, partial [Phycisphaerales bacterium]|nr:hypothetical protein [Phycisphaerales bacterium]